MQARASGLGADSLALALEYSPSERRRVDAGLKRSRYDDGNVRDELFASGRQRLATGEHHLLDGVAGLSLGRGSAEAADYYSPTRSASLDLGLEAGHLAWRRYDHALRQELAIGAGLGWQEGFGTHWTPSLRYGHAWDLGEGRTLSWSIGVSRPVYDGVREQRVRGRPDVRCRGGVRRCGDVGRGGVLRRDGRLFAQQDRALVETFGHPHDLHARHPVSRHDGALDRGGAAPAGQEAGVDVEASVERGIQHLTQQDLAVGHDHRRIEIERAERLDLLRGLHGLGRANLKPQPLGEGMHRRGFELHPSAARSWRL